MKTHELAQLLEGVAHLLRAAPDRELIRTDRKRRDDGLVSGSYALMTDLKRKQTPTKAVPRLESLDKRQLENIISVNKLPIGYRKKDSTQVLMRRVSNYLDKNPLVKKRLRNSIVHTPSGGSPSLTQALTYLLRDKYE